MSRSPRLLPAAVLVIAAAACGEPEAGPPDATPVTACNDGIDNDGDRSTDYPADPGCDHALDLDESNPPVAMCSDGRDNDGDTFTDYPNDPGCYTPLQDDEDDDCPSGDDCPDCANGMDEDMDGQIDFPADAGCSAASDNDEYETNPNACGPNMIVTRLMTHDATVTVPNMPSDITGVCGGAGGEFAYEILITQPSVFIAHTDNTGTAINTLLYLRTDCLDGTTEMACNDNISTMNNRSRIQANLTPGLYYLVIDTPALGTGGQVFLHVDTFAGEGVECTNQAECGPGLQCRTPMGQTTMVCAQPVCNDTDDEDGDGDAAFPDDPGCASAEDFTEEDDCPTGMNCPACADTIDNDGDLAIDYPADTDCTSASQPVEGCGIESDPMFTMTSSPVTGNLVGLTDDFDLTCDSTGGLDQVYFIQVPQMQSLRLDTIGSPTDTVVAVYPSTCTGTALGCNDDGGGAGTSLLNLTNVAPGSYAVVVSNYSTSFPPGPYNLSVSGTIAPAGACTAPLATSGALTCPSGYACINGTCTGNLQCNNGMDDDGDGDTDFPNDPGCATNVDDDELDDCPSGPMCPACSNTLDDDMDGQIDYPMDTDCTFAGGAAEVCGAETDPVVVMTTPSITGTTVGATPNFTLACGFNTAVAPDRVALLTLPTMSSLNINMLGSNYDAVLALKTAACGTASIACTDSFTPGGEVINLTTGLAAGTYAVIIDGYNGLSGNYTLNVTGKIANGASCESPLVTAGALTCNTGYACKGMPGTRTCELAACNDAVDADGDTFPGFPTDPGCASLDDDDESDMCPSGPGCPACSNDLDDDGDSLIDYPQDFGCSGASGTSEVACMPETDPIGVIAMPVHTNTTAGKANNFTPPATCVSGSNAPDVTYIFSVPVTLSTLVIDTLTSPYDTVLMWDDPACATPPLACNNNDTFPLTTSKLTLTNVTPGAYAITVDGTATNSGTFALHVDGRAAPGSACTSPLFAAGVLSCGVGQNCMAGVCQ
jgi:hypothetical protein